MKKILILISTMLILFAFYYRSSEDSQLDQVLLIKSPSQYEKPNAETASSENYILENQDNQVQATKVNSVEPKKYVDPDLERYLKIETELALKRGVITSGQIEEFQIERKNIYSQEQARIAEQNQEVLAE